MYKSILSIILSSSLLVLSACEEIEDIANDTPKLSLTINDSSHSSSSPYQVSTDPFKVSWTGSTRVDFYISSTKSITDSSKKVYGYNWGAYDLNCAIDASYVEIDCDLNDEFGAGLGRANISDLVTELPITLYLIAKETTYSYSVGSVADEVQVVSQAIELK